jgi:hypothetical protein
VQPWGDLANPKRYQLPKALVPAGKRVVRNLDRFQSNYALVLLAFTVAAILLSPILLLGIAVCLVACYAIMRRGQDKRLAVWGYEFSAQHQYVAVGIFSIPFLWLIGAGATVTWVLGISSIVALIHAAIYNSDEDLKDPLVEHV